MNTAFDIEVFYDGDCPLCRREIGFLRRLDRQSRIRFTDIASPDFVAAGLGVDHEALMAQIHGRLPDGGLIRGVEVFRRLYTAVGWGRVMSFTRLPGVSHLMDVAYRLFARHRLRLTGRCNDACRVRPSRS